MIIYRDCAHQMPRDLAALTRESTLNDMPALTKSPNDVEDSSGRQASKDNGQEDSQPQEGLLFSQLAQRNEKRDELHPYVQTLSPSDVESCTRLEEEAFPPNERATREKVGFAFVLSVSSLGIAVHLGLEQQFTGSYESRSCKVAVIRSSHHN